MVIPEAARRLIDSAPLAHLVTLNPDGSPQVTVVWAGLEGDELVVGHLGEGRKIGNVQRDPRVAISMESSKKNELGLTEYLVLHGQARVTDGRAAEVLQRLAHGYLGPEVRFPPFDDPPPGHVLHVAVDRVGGVGPWATPTVPPR